MAGLESNSIQCPILAFPFSRISSNRPVPSRLVFRLMGTFCCLAVFGNHSCAFCQSPPIELIKNDDRVSVHIDDELFTEYIHSGYERPILYPVNAAGERSVVRNYPMVSDVQGESSDHPHHQSVWFAHGDVNGLDFWSNKALIVNTSVAVAGDAIVSNNEWHGPEQVVCSDQTVIRFAAINAWRMIDYDVKIVAGAEPVTFGDTKEGLFAIRTHPRLRIQDADGAPMASAFNSEGVTSKGIWGQSAKWVHYQNTFGDQTIGVTVIDAPTNLRHPNYWHAREYGLIAANPFGLHGLGGLPDDSGAVTLGPGQSLSLRYAVVIWNRSATAEDVEQVFKDYSRSCFATGLIK